MAVLCGMPTIQYSAQSAWLSVRLSKCVCPKITSGKVIWHKAHRCRRWMVQCYSTGDGNVSFHKGTLVSTGEYDWTCAFFSPLESTTDKANGSVQLFLHSLQQKVPIRYNGRPYPPELPLPMGYLDFPCNTWCLRPMRVHNPNGTSIGSAVFAQMTAECLYTLQWFACFPLKTAPSHVGIWTSFNKWFIGPTRVWNTNCNLIVSAIFAGLTDWQSDRKTEKTTLLSAMQRNNS